MQKKHLNITVQGRVQGVSYRYTTKAVADQLGVREAEADEWNMQLFLDWCNDGPTGAIVSSITTDEADFKNYRNFEIVKRNL
jgi:acylphosphatase